jgi:fluoroquinolone resistance protein
MKRKHLITISNDYSNNQLDEEEYEQYLFSSCDFTNANLNGVVFEDCFFEQCNFSNARIEGAAFKNCTFIECKMLGISFAQTKDFGFEIHAHQCNMSFVSFDKKKLYKSTFKQCNMEGVNFTQSTISGCKFDACNFLDAQFSNTNLSGVDFRTNVQFIIHPEANTITKARFASQDLFRLLAAYNIQID